MTTARKKAETMTDWTADRLNNHLENGGVVQVTTYLRSTVYEPKHAGLFFEKAGELFVKRGRKADCLGRTAAPLVGIRLGRYA